LETGVLPVTESEIIPNPNTVWWVIMAVGVAVAVAGFVLRFVLGRRSEVVTAEVDFSDLDETSTEEISEADEEDEPTQDAVDVDEVDPETLAGDPVVAEMEAEDAEREPAEGEADEAAEPEVVEGLSADLAAEPVPQDSGEFAHEDEEDASGDDD